MHSFILAFLGGVLIGVATSAFLLFKGRIFGISGILGGFFKKPTSDFSWRLVTVIGLVTGGALAFFFFPESFPSHEKSYSLLLIAGLLVGFGTQLGGGCTSGHGVCGISRFSPRSMVATSCFMITGMLTVFFLELGGFL